MTVCEYADESLYSLFITCVPEHTSEDYFVTFNGGKEVVLIRLRFNPIARDRNVSYPGTYLDLWRF